MAEETHKRLKFMCGQTFRLAVVKFIFYFSFDS